MKYMKNLIKSLLCSLFVLPLVGCSQESGRLGYTNNPNQSFGGNGETAGPYPSTATVDDAIYSIHDQLKMG